jgi:GntR family transcriptional regulator of arabinose operon
MFTEKGCHEKVYEGITKMLRKGELARSQKLPAERELIDKFGVSRPTINKAITRLVAEGLLYKKSGRKGTFVNGDKQKAQANSVNTSVESKLVKYIVPKNWGKFPVKHGVMEGIYSVASERGLQTVLEYVASKDEWAHKVLCTDNCRPAGLVIWGHSFELSLEEIDALNDSGIPYVIVDSMPEKGEFNFVGTDNIKGAQMMVDYLFSLGHKNICYITEQDIKGSVKQRLSGFLHGMISNNLNITSETVLKINEADENSLFILISKLMKQEYRPSAIFASHDKFLVKIYDILSHLGIRCPIDVSLAGYDDIDISAHMPVPFTTVRQNFYKMGRYAVELLLNENGSLILPQRVMLEPELVIRKSTAEIAKDK